MDAQTEQALVGAMEKAVQQAESAAHHWRGRRRGRRGGAPPRRLPRPLLRLAGPSLLPERLSCLGKLAIIPGYKAGGTAHGPQHV